MRYLERFPRREKEPMTAEELLTAINIEAELAERHANRASELCEEYARLMSQSSAECGELGAIDDGA